MLRRLSIKTQKSKVLYTLQEHSIQSFCTYKIEVQIKIGTHKLFLQKLSFDLIFLLYPLFTV